MTERTDPTPVAAIEAKWISARPEFGLALKFVSLHERLAQAAFACLVFELEDAAFATLDAEPATLKLQWWNEELVRSTQQLGRHPLTQALTEWIPGFDAIPVQFWTDAVRGALVQRDADPARDMAAGFAHYALLYRPIGEIEAHLFGSDAGAVTSILIATRALRETAAIELPSGNASTALPLDLLARHRLTRNQLSQASVQRSAALRDWMRMLGDELDRQSTRAPAGAGVLLAAMAAVDGVRAHRAARARDPLLALAATLHTLPIAGVWSAWRATRRARAR